MNKFIIHQIFVHNFCNNLWYIHNFPNFVGKYQDYEFKSKGDLQGKEHPTERLS